MATFVEGEDGMYAVEALLEVTKKAGYYWFLVKWKDYNEKNWEPRSSFGTNPGFEFLGRMDELIREYRARRPGVPESEEAQWLHEELDRRSHRRRQRQLRGKRKNPGKASVQPRVTQRASTVKRRLPSRRPTNSRRTATGPKKTVVIVVNDTDSESGETSFHQPPVCGTETASLQESPSPASVELSQAVQVADSSDGEESCSGEEIVVDDCSSSSSDDSDWEDGGSDKAPSRQRKRKKQSDPSETFESSWGDSDGFKKCYQINGLLSRHTPGFPPFTSALNYPYRPIQIVHCDVATPMGAKVGRKAIECDEVQDRNWGKEKGKEKGKQEYKTGSERTLEIPEERELPRRRSPRLNPGTANEETLTQGDSDGESLSSLEDAEERDGDKSCFFEPSNPFLSDECCLEKGGEGSGILQAELGSRDNEYHHAKCADPEYDPVHELQRVAEVGHARGSFFKTTTALEMKARDERPSADASVNPRKQLSPTERLKSSVWREGSPPGWGSSCEFRRLYHYGDD